MRKLILICFAAAFILGNLKADQSLDSLYNVWQSENDPTIKFEIGYNLLWKYIYADLDKAIVFSDTLIYSEKSNELNLWKAKSLKAEILRRKGEDEEALSLLLLLEKQAYEQNWIDHLPEVWNSLAFLFDGLKNWDRSIDYFEKAAEVYIDNENFKQSVLTLSNLSDAYLEAGDTLAAKDVNFQVLEITERAFDPQVLGHVLEWSKEMDLRFSGKCLYSLEQLEQILDYSYKVKNLMTTLHFFLSKMECLYENQDYSQLISFAESVQADFDAYSDLHLNLPFYEMLQVAYEQQEQWQDAYYAKVKHDSLGMVLFNREKQESITEQELKYQKLQNENLEQETQNAVKAREQAMKGNIILIFLGACSLLIFFLLWKQRTTNEKLEKEQLERQIWQLQFNPHFFFNALTSIQASLYEGNPTLAIKAVNRLATMFRQTLSRSQLEWTPLNTELEFLQEYIEIHKFMSGDEFDFEIEIDPSIKAKDVQIPPFLFQPIVENAIKHGFKDQGEQRKKNRILVKLKQQDGEIMTSIYNNGSIYKVKPNKNTTSLGLKITDKRLLSYVENGKGLSIQNNRLNDENWVEVSFSVPIQFPVN